MIEANTYKPVNMSASPQVPPETIYETITPPGSTHSHTVVFLHGRGSNASKIKSEFLASQTPGDLSLFDVFPTFKWVFPGAEQRPGDAPQENMSQWFDMIPEDAPYRDLDRDLPGLRHSVAFIKEVLEYEARKLQGGMQAIYLGGIGQGFVTAFAAFFATGKRLAGFLGVRCWIPIGFAPFDCPWPGLLINWVHQGLIPDQPMSVLAQTPMLLGYTQEDEGARELCLYLGGQGMKGLVWQHMWGSENRVEPLNRDTAAEPNRLAAFGQLLTNCGTTWGVEWSRMGDGDV